MQKLLRRIKTIYEPVDRSLRIVPQNPRFWDYLRTPKPDKPVALTDVFHELVGVEQDIRKLIEDGSGDFEIPIVSRNVRSGLREKIYFNLTILAVSEFEFPAVVIIDDETMVMEAQQQVVQSNNEIVLLKRDLERQNLELSTTNRQLDILGKELSIKNEQLNNLITLVRTQNHDLESKVRLRTRELWDSRLEIVKRLAQAAEYRDADTGSHLFRMSRSSVLIAKQMGLSEGECEMILHASLLHDVGKIGIPDAILMKPGGLSPEEWEIMKRHTTIGAEMLHGKSSQLIETGRDIALRHHEKWNGTGYPEGLKGESIPLFARICAVADVFDALTSERPYKKPWSADRSAEEINAESGRSFDPAAVEAFLFILPDIVVLRRQADTMQAGIPEL